MQHTCVHQHSILLWREEVWTGKCDAGVKIDDSNDEDALL